MMHMKNPIARGPLVDRHRQSGATLEMIDGWLVAKSYPPSSEKTRNTLIDLSHRHTFEINGADTEDQLSKLCGTAVPLRRIHSKDSRDVYRLTPSRAIVFGKLPKTFDALDVTGGWASFALVGSHVEQILNKVTAVDLRERTLPALACCQGPIFGVNTLFGRLADRFELHVCTDSAEFFWDVLLDAGAEFSLQPAGLDRLTGK